MTNQCIKCEKEIEDYYDLCTDCAKDAFADNIFWMACDPLISKPVINRFREHSETILTIGERPTEILFDQGQTVEEEIESFDPEDENDYKSVHEKMNSILGEMGVSKEFKRENYLFSKEDMKVFSQLFLKLEKIEHEFSDTEGLDSLYLRFGNLFFYNAIKTDIGIFEPGFRDRIVNDMLKESEGFYTLAIHAEHDNPISHKNIGKLLLKRDKNEKAVESIKKSLDLEESLETQKLLVKAFIKSEKLQEAEERLEDLDEDDDYWILKGDLAKARGGWGRAIQFYEESSGDEAYIKKADLFLKNERYEPALEAYSEYLKRDENNHRVLKEKAKCLLELGRKEEALNHIKKSISIDPQDDEKWFILGDLMEDKGQTDDAKEAFQNAVKLNPENKDAENRLEDL